MRKLNRLGRCGIRLQSLNPSTEYRTTVRRGTDILYFGARNRSQKRHRYWFQNSRHRID